MKVRNVKFQQEYNISRSFTHSDSLKFNQVLYYQKGQIIEIEDNQVSMSNMSVNALLTLKKEYFEKIKFSKKLCFLKNNEKTTGKITF